MRRFSLLLTLIALGFVVLACGRSQRRGQSGDFCADASACEADPGEIAACIDHECEVVQCLTSSDCAVGSFCDVDEHTCEDGCQTGDDCLATESCDGGACVATGCRDAVLDCPWGMACNETSGACEPVAGTYCNGCDATAAQWNQGNLFDVCDDTYIGHTSCGGAGAFCLNATVPYCAPPCDADGTCPWGYMCSPVSIDLSAQGCGSEPRILGNACVPIGPCSEMP